MLPCVMVTATATAMAAGDADTPPGSGRAVGSPPAAATDPAIAPGFGQKADPAATGFQESLLLVDINAQLLNETTVVLERDGVIYVAGADLLRWRLRLPEPGVAVDHDGEKYYPLAAIAGVAAVFNAPKRTLTITASALAFTETARVAAGTARLAPLRSGPGGFINYDLFAARDPTGTQRSGQFEFGYFNHAGVGTTSLFANDTVNIVNTGNAGNAGDNGNTGERRLTRLDSTWTVDYPETLRSLRLGDAINRPGAWGRAVRFGGLQYGSNFATQPGFVTAPLQSVAGRAVLPSTVDVFVNNALVSRQTVPPGPFTIRNLPVVTGTGEVQLVVRDLFGREQLTTQPFYASQALLREGLTSYSVEAGKVRENFGIDSFNYGSAMGSATYRRGMSQHFTAEVHAEAMPGQATAGAGGDYLLPRIGTLNAHVAGSQSRQGSGATLLLGIDHPGRKWSYAARTQRTSSGFVQVGRLPGDLPPSRLSSFNLSYATGAGSSVGVAYVVQRNRVEADVRIATLGYNVSLGKWASLSVSAVRVLEGDKSTSVFAALTIPFGAATSLSLSAQSVGGGSSDFTATLQRNLPAGEGYGYRVLARSDRSQEAAATLQNNIGTYGIGVAQTPGATATRLSASGGVAFLGGDAFLSRRIDQSFAVVRVPGYPNVHILADNNPAGQTNAAGNALIPRLRAYDRNVLAIQQEDLPMDAEIGALEREVAPYFRSGVEVKFPVRRSRGATLTIVLDDGRALPLGATVEIIGQDRLNITGYEGEVYVTGLEPQNRLRASWNGQSCEFDAAFVISANPLPDLGTFICHGVKR